MNLKFNFGKIINLLLSKVIALLFGLKYENGQFIIFDDTELFEDIKNKKEK